MNKHIIRQSHDDGTKLATPLLWCGASPEPFGWFFQDAQHALNAAEQETLQQPCRKCMWHIQSACAGYLSNNSQTSPQLQDETMTERNYHSEIKNCVFDTSITNGLLKGSVARGVGDPIPAQERNAMFFQDKELLANGLMEVQLDGVTLMSVPEYERLKKAAGEPVV